MIDIDIEPADQSGEQLIPHRLLESIPRDVKRRLSGLGAPDLSILISGALLVALVIVGYLLS